jgi:cysteine desulfurase
LPETVIAVSKLRDQLVDGIMSRVPDAVLNGDPGDGLIDGGPSRLPGNAHLTFPGCEGESLLMLLDARDIQCSTGAACTAGVAQPSHVLLAMGVTAAVARSSLRFSLGRTTTAADVGDVLDAIEPVVARSRSAATRRARAS